VLEQLDACQVFPWRKGRRNVVFGANLSEIERVVNEWRAGRGHFDHRTGQHRAVVVGAAAVRIYDMLMQQRPER